MKIVLDTTVFGHGFTSRSVDVRLLKNFLDRTGAELCVPAVVLEEAVNLVRKSVLEANHKLDATLRLTGDDKAYRKFDVESGLTAYRESLDVLLKFLNARTLPYPSVLHEALVLRALAPNKPFVSGGRGYRDALIWFSVLELGQRCDQEIGFISGNSEDWCRSKKDLRLHDDFLDDLKNAKLDTSRVRFFPSLDEFIQQVAVTAMPISVQSAEIATQPPDYLQLLIDGQELIETLLENELPDFLRTLSGADGRVEELEVLGINAPTEVQPSPIREVDAQRRLLQFSAKYTVAVQFLIRRSDLPVWSQRLTLHMTQDWDETRQRVQATRTIRVFFNMIEHGEEPESFSILQISPAYKVVYEGIEPVAVKLNQSIIHAPEHGNFGKVKCEFCNDEFGVGHHWLYTGNTEDESVAKLKGILAADHKAGRRHQNLYEIVV